MKQTRVAIYTRVSTDDQSTKTQEHELRQYAKHRGWTVQQVYTDHGFSGASEKWPALDELLRDTRKRKFDVVLVRKFDRFARSLRQLVSALELFRKFWHRLRVRHRSHRHITSVRRVGVPDIWCNRSVRASIDRGTGESRTWGSTTQRKADRSPAASDADPGRAHPHPKGAPQGPESPQTGRVIRHDTLGGARCLPGRPLR